MKKWFFVISIIFCIFPCVAFGENFYFAQNQQGGGDGTSCASAKAISWFNSTGNWGSGTNEISAGDICYLCDNGGIIITPMTTRGNGGSGNEITIKPAPGETVTLRHFSIKHNYIILDGVDPSGTPNLTVDSNTDAEENGTGVWVTGDNVTVTNCFVTESPWGGIRFTSATRDGWIYRNRCYHNGQWGIQVDGTNNLVEENEIWESVQYHNDGGPPSNWGADADAMRVFGDGHIIRGNYIHEPALMSDPGNNNPHIDAIQTFCSDANVATNCIFEYNYVKHKQSGMYTFMWEDSPGPNTIRHNVFEVWHGFNAEGKSGAGCSQISTNVTITNNTWIGDCSHSSGWPMFVEASGANYTVKNNLSICYQENHRNISNGSGRAVDYNWMYNPNRSVSVGTPSKQSNDTTDIDPQLSNLNGGEYWPISSSGLIDSGVDLGMQSGLLSSTSWTTWPINIVTADQDGNGNGWEIGAYVYEEGNLADTEPPTTPKNLVASNVTQNSLLLSWSAATDNRGVAGYRVFRNGQLHDTTTSTSYSDIDLSPATQYIYRVSAYDGASNESPKSTSLEITTGSITYFSPGEYIEAESGDMDTVIQMGSDGNASGGKYIYASNENSGLVSFVFEITEANTYALKTKVLAAGDGHNSFYVGVDSEPANGNDAYVYDTMLNSSFLWDNLSLRGSGDPTNNEFDPMTWYLTTGLHTFTFYAREADTRLDQIILIEASNAPPSPPTGFIIVGEN